MPTALGNAQKRYLRGLAHDLKPILLVGAKLWLRRFSTGPAEMLQKSLLR